MADMAEAASSTSPRRTPSAGRLAQIALLPLVAVVLLASLGVLLARALGGEWLVKLSALGSLARTTAVVHDARPWLIAAAASSIAGLIGWALAQRKIASLAGIAASEREARSDEERARRELSEAQDELATRTDERDEARTQRDSAVQNWKSTRDWNRELRNRIARLQQERGFLARHDDVREMVLELTMHLTDAEKGILLSDRQTSDGTLRVVCALGFENDPEDSRIAQRFATQVIERDTTIREDERACLDDEKRTAADEEIKNLLAIPVYVLDDFSGVIVCANREEGFESLDDEVLMAVGDHAGAVLQNARLHGDLRSAYLSTIRALANAIELKDPDLRGHSDAVSEYVHAVADRMEFEPRRREALIFGSLLHDVGKLGISERILLKPGALTDEERSVIELHPRIGYQLVRQVPALEQIAPAVLHHHERFDGDGYPGRLRGEAIPLEARIIAVADAFSAMTSDRPYSKARDPEEACVELERCAGEQFDPEVVRLFVEEVRRRPPDQFESTESPPDPDLEVYREDGEFVFGMRSFEMTDSLTLLYCHRHFHDTARAEAQRAMVQDQPFAIVMVELTSLGEVNRTRGFAAGDAALQSTARTLQRIAARCDGLAFRVSGRRLAVLVSGMDQLAADTLCSSLLEELNSGLELSIAATVWRPGEDGEQVIERALTAAKQSTLA
jgi:diguanylate cyclase (GGDEF)-like protein